MFVVLSCRVRSRDGVGVRVRVKARGLGLGLVREGEGGGYGKVEVEVEVEGKGERVSSMVTVVRKEEVAKETPCHKSKWPHYFHITPSCGSLVLW